MILHMISFPRIQNWSFSAAILNFGGHIEIQLLIY